MRPVWSAGEAARSVPRAASQSCMSVCAGVLPACGEGACVVAGEASGEVMTVVGVLAALHQDFFAGVKLRACRAAS